MQDNEERNREPKPSESGNTRAPEDPMLYCPNCSQRLTQNHCKLVCEKCGYFMSCADYY